MGPIKLIYKFEGETYKLSPLQIKILETLDERGPLLRGYKEDEGPTLKNILERPRTTIYENLVPLEEKGLVRKFDTHNGKGGRPKVKWEIINGGDNKDVQQ